MATYKTYQEAKIANPDSDIFVSMGGEFSLPDHVGYVSMCGTGEGWNKCNPADYCMSVYDFLKSGKKIVKGDYYLGYTGRVRHVDDDEFAASVNRITDGCDAGRFVLRAKALEEVEYEYVKATDSIFDLRPDFEAGELYAYNKDYTDLLSGETTKEHYSVIKCSHELVSKLANDNVFYRRIKKPDWRDEVVKEFGSPWAKKNDDNNADLIVIGDITFNKGAAEVLAKAILRGIEKAK